MKKKLLTIDDLYSFYAQGSRSVKFSSKESGYQIAVQIPAQFEINKDQEDSSLLFCKIKLMHSGVNVNKSCLTDEALEKASKTLAYKPILAGFCETVDEDGNSVRDFTYHDIELDENGEFVYIEHQIGCFTSDDAYIEKDEETGNNYLYGYGAIPRDYTDACEIIERKNGTTVSAELGVNEMSYDAKSKVLNLNDVVVLGVTCLGTNPETGEEVLPGMKGARLDIIDFSTEKNSVKFDKDEKLIEALDRLNVALSSFNNGQMSGDHSREGGKSKMPDDVINMDENLEIEDENPELENDNPESEEPEVTDEQTEATEEDEVDDVEPDEENELEEGAENFESNEQNMTRTFDISHDDVRCALYGLLAPYEEANQEWYYIIDVFDDYFIYQGSSGIYGQKYSKSGDVVAFDGERYGVHAEYLTDSEYATLQEMRQNYAELRDKVSNYECAESRADKMTVFDDEAYTDYLDTEDFKALMSNEFIDKCSKEELQDKADAALGKLVKQSKTFTYSEKKKSNKVIVPIITKSEKKKPYGTLFD